MDLSTIPVSVLEACHAIDLVPVGSENIAVSNDPLTSLFFLRSGSQQNQLLPLLQLYAGLWCVAPVMGGTVITDMSNILKAPECVISLCPPPPPLGASQHHHLLQQYPRQHDGAFWRVVS